MEYAAVIIPTLNRKKHLKRCVESLLKSKESEYTDLYISVDYPPNDKYWDGYDDVKEYVNTINGFQKVEVFFQRTNLGPGLNRNFLEQKIKEDGHDKYVFTDDDNEFSANFLEYINWGLEKYADDESIYAICSKADFLFDNKKTDSDFMILKAYNPYGAGHWLHKNEKCRKYLTQDNIEKIYLSTELQNKIYMESPMLLRCLATDLTRDVHAMRGKDGGITYIDIWENVYCIVNDKKCIIPIIGKSRNWGIDGTGIHSSSDEKINAEPVELIDEEKEWKKFPKCCDEEIEEQYRKLHQNKFMTSEKEKKKCMRKMWLYMTLGESKFRKLVQIYRSVMGNKVSIGEDIFYG